MDPSCDEIKAAITAIDWSQYESAYGPADREHPYYTSSGSSPGYFPKIPDALLSLFSGPHDAAMRACHELWCGLCHQHAYLSTAALPSCDFLLCALRRRDEEIMVELLDILYGFAACTARPDISPWEQTLRAKLKADRPCFQSLAVHPNEFISGFAEDILAML